jgi:xanthine dehydrogenase accessory factor
MMNLSGLEAKAKELTEQGKHFTLATVVRCQSPTSAKPGAKARVTFEGEIFGWIGGGCAQPAVKKTVRECIQSGQAQLIRVTPTQQTDVEDGIVKFNMACHSGGTLDIFIEPMTMKPMLLILGASPVAQALSNIAAISGFEVTVAAQNIDANLFSDQVSLLDSFEIPDMYFNRMPYVVISTQGKGDSAGLNSALNIASPYTALIASTKKGKKLLEAASSKASPEAIAKVKFPAGIPIGANTPDEIAVSLLAQLIEVKNKGGLDMHTPPFTRSELTDNAQQKSNAKAKPDTTQNDAPVNSPQSTGCCGSK